jgi:hypothetical protein
MSVLWSIIKRLVRGVVIVGVALFVLAVAYTFLTGNSISSSRPPDFTGLVPREAKNIDPRLLASDPSTYKGEHLKLQGEAVNVEQSRGYTWISFSASTTSGGTESVVVHLFPPDKKLLKDEYYCVYGLGGGTTDVVLQLTGAEQKRPLVNAYKITKSRRGGSCVGQD